MADPDGRGEYWRFSLHLAAEDMVATVVEMTMDPEDVPDFLESMAEATLQARQAFELYYIQEEKIRD